MNDTKQIELSNVKQDTVHVVIIHTTLILFLIVLLTCLAPRLFAIMENYLGFFHPAFLLAVGISDFVRLRFWFLLPAVALFLWLDAEAYRRLYVKEGKRAAFLWSYGIVVALMVFTILYLYALSIPLVRIAGR